MLAEVIQPEGGGKTLGVLDTATASDLSSQMSTVAGVKDWGRE